MINIPFLSLNELTRVEEPSFALCSDGILGFRNTMHAWIGLGQCINHPKFGCPNPLRFGATGVRSSSQFLIK